MNRSHLQLAVAAGLILIVAFLCLLGRGCQPSSPVAVPAPAPLPAPSSWVARPTEPPLTIRFNSVSDFSAEKNPAGAWSYGRLDPAGTFQLYDTQHREQGTEGWRMSQSPDSQGIILHNPTAETIRLVGTIELPPHALSMHPGKDHHQAVLRWTAPQGGEVSVTGSIRGYSLIGGTPQTVLSVCAGNDKLFSLGLNADGRPNQEAFQFSRQVKAGDFIDFRLDYPGQFFCLTTGIDVSLSLQPAVPPAAKQ